MEHGVRLLELGCDHAQGYAIARPMPAQAMPDWIAGWRPLAGGWIRRISGEAFSSLVSPGSCSKKRTAPVLPRRAFSGFTQYAKRVVLL